MSDTHTEIRSVRYRDADGNLYGVERSAKTGRWIVIRTNPGGNRKMLKQIDPRNSRGACQWMLDDCAELNNWKAVEE